MKYLSTLVTCLIIVLVSCTSRSKNASEGVKKAQDLSVMTYNIRLNVASDGENAWSNRKNFLCSQVQFYYPDILCVQEARPKQMTHLKSALKSYTAFGKGRDGENKGEYSAIFYNSEKIKVERENTFWLSKTPEKPSKGWDAAYPRICTYGLFTLLKSKHKVWLFNTHLDHKGVEAQLQGMQLILKRIKEVNIDNYPVIITGDFNVEPNSELIKSLKQEMDDTKDISEIKFGPDGTFNGFNFLEPVTRRIDYIMVSKSRSVEVEKYGVISSSKNLRYPSDHFPVFVKFSLK